MNQQATMWVKSERERERRGKTFIPFFIEDWRIWNFNEPRAVKWWLSHSVNDANNIHPVADEWSNELSPVKNFTMRFRVGIDCEALYYIKQYRLDGELHNNYWTNIGIDY